MCIDRSGDTPVAKLGPVVKFLLFRPQLGLAVATGASGVGVVSTGVGRGVVATGVGRGGALGMAGHWMAGGAASTADDWWD